MMMRVLLLLVALVAPVWALPGVTGTYAVQGLTGPPNTIWPVNEGEGWHTYRVSVTTSTAIYDPPGNLCIVVYHYNAYGEGATAGIDPFNIPLSGAQSVSETLHTLDGEFLVFNWPTGPGCQPNNIPGPYDYSVVIEKLA